MKHFELTKELTVQQSEALMGRLLLEYAKDFYKNPVNQQAYAAWEKDMEEKEHGAD